MPPQRTPRRDRLDFLTPLITSKWTWSDWICWACVRELRGRFADSLGPASLERARSPLDAPASAATSQGPSVFICHASEDKDKASQPRRCSEACQARSTVGLTGPAWWVTDGTIPTAATIEKVDYFVILNRKGARSEEPRGVLCYKEIRPGSSG